MRKALLIGPVAALAILTGCSAGNAGSQSPGPAGTGTGASGGTTTTSEAPSRLTKSQFTAELKSAGWHVGAQAYDAAVRFCATETSDDDLRHFAELAKPEATDHQLDVYVDAVRHSC